MDQVALRRDQRRVFVVASLQADFVAPARFNDEIVVTARLAELSRASFDIEQNIHLDSLEGKLLLRASVRAAYLNADSMRPVRVPESIFEGIKS